MDQTGAIITRGPQDWQVLQQRDGKADIALEGVWVAEGDAAGAVYARVVWEDSGEAVLPWTKAEARGGNRWTVTLRGIPAGGLYRVETGFAPDSLELLEWMARGDMAHHLAVGDLYVIAGQSNAAGYGKDMAYDPPELGVHLLRNNGRWDIATHPMNESTGTIHPANREGGNPGHSPWLSFAKMVRRETGVPVGLVQTSLGGSPLDEWLPGGRLYANMLEIVEAAGGRVRGVLWYQGCSDAGFPLCGTYFERFHSFVDGVRGALDAPGLPFITVQISRYVAAGADDAADLAWGIVREAQRQAALQIPGVSLVPTMDCSLSDAIHISALSNLALGERAARVALSRLYGRPAAADAPDIIKAEMTEDGVLLTFGNVTQRIYAFEVPPKRLPFRLEDEVGVAEIDSYSQPAADQLLLRPARPLRGRCAVAGHYGRDPQGMQVIDTGTRLPMPAFYGVLVK